MRRSRLARCLRDDVGRPTIFGTKDMVCPVEGAKASHNGAKAAHTTQRNTALDDFISSEQFDTPIVVAKKKILVL